MRMLGSFLTFLAVLTILVPPPAFAATQSFITPVPFTSAVNDCNGETVNFTGNQHSTIGVTEAKSGGLHLRASLDWQGVSGVGEVTGVKYQIPTTFNFSNNMGSATTFTFTQNLRIVAKGNVPNFNGHVTFHFTFNANGEMTASVDNFSFDCNG